MQGSLPVGHPTQTLQQLLPKRRVLLVEDDRDSADTLALLLETAGADVRVARDGPQALAIALAHQPEIVFLDLALPGMSGLEVAQALLCPRHHGQGDARGDDWLRKC